MDKNERQAKELKSWERWYGILSRLPVIFMVIYAIAVLIVGIAVTAAGIDGGITAMVWLIGIASWFIVYPVLKMSLAYTCLKMCYLREISSKLDRK